jgi:hypothetical protein
MSTGLDNDNFIISSTTAVHHTGALNASLLKLGTFAQTMLGVVLTTTVLAATVGVVVLTSVGVTYDPPVAHPDFVDAYKNTVTLVFPLKNDLDPKGGTLTITALTNPVYGSASIVNNGQAIQYKAPGIILG